MSSFELKNGTNNSFGFCGQWKKFVWEQKNHRLVQNTVVDYFTNFVQNATIGPKKGDKNHTSGVLVQKVILLGDSWHLSRFLDPNGRGLQH